MKVIYLAGPFRAPNSWEMEQNIRRAEETALEIWRLGAACFCPHLNTRFFQGVLPDTTWLTGDLELLKRCDGVFALPGSYPSPTWSASTLSAGAQEELRVAQTFRIPVFFTLKALEAFLLYT